FGLRPGWDLKEPLTTDEDMRRAEVVMQRLVVLLAGDGANQSVLALPHARLTQYQGRRLAPLSGNRSNGHAVRHHRARRHARPLWSAAAALCAGQGAKG